MRFPTSLEGVVVPIPCDQIFVASSTWSNARRTLPPDCPAVVSTTRQRGQWDNTHHGSVQRQPVANCLCPLLRHRPMNSNSDDVIVTRPDKPMTSWFKGRHHGRPSLPSEPMKHSPSKFVLRKIHDCTFRLKYFLRDFLDPKFPENFHLISQKLWWFVGRRHQMGLFFDCFRLIYQNFWSPFCHWPLIWNCRFPDLPPVCSLHSYTTFSSPLKW